MLGAAFLKSKTWSLPLRSSQSPGGDTHMREVYFHGRVRSSHSSRDCDLGEHRNISKADCMQHARSPRTSNLGIHLIDLFVLSFIPSTPIYKSLNMYQVLGIRPGKNRLSLVEEIVT
jgi:hypothetical protein